MKNHLSIKIFISYAREDAEIALKINNDLNQKGLVTWIDRKELLPGQNWRSKIKQEIKSCTHFITLLSPNSNKRGFLQKEIKYAFEVLDEIPDEDIFIIPVRIKNCKIIERFKDIHVVDLFPSYKDCIERIIKSISLKISYLNFPDNTDSGYDTKNIDKSTPPKRIKNNNIIEKIELLNYKWIKYTKGVHLLSDCFVQYEKSNL